MKKILADRQHSTRRGVFVPEFVTLALLILFLALIVPALLFGDDGSGGYDGSYGGGDGSYFCWDEDGDGFCDRAMRITDGPEWAQRVKESWGL